MRSRTSRPARLSLWLAAAGLFFSSLSPSADVVPFSPTVIRPEGGAGLAALLAGENLAVQTPALQAQVAQQGFFTGEALGTSDCAGCHSEIAAQWAQSAHHFSSFNNPYYAASVELLRTQRPLTAGRFCAGCHDPLLLVDDSISSPTLRRDLPAAQAGLPCLVCHSMITPAHTAGGSRSRLGNGAYEVSATPVPPPGPPPRSDGERTPHAARLRPGHMSQPTFCAACHKVGLAPNLTHASWLRGQDDYGAWLASVAAGNGVGAVYRPERVEVKRCQDCHMPLEPLRNGRLVRSHRFLAANTALPQLRGDEDMQRREEAFLRGAISLDIAVWPDAGDAGGGGPPPRFDRRVQLAPRDSSRLRFDVVLRNRRVGHRFPGGTNDSNDVWVEVSIARPGQPPLLLDDTHLVRAQPVDENGQPLLRRDPQNTRAVVYNTSLSPADPQVIRFQADLDRLWSASGDEAAAPLELRARLRYRKFTPDYAEFSCRPLPAGPAKDRCLQPPTVDVAEARRLIARGLPPSDPAPTTPVEGEPPLWERYLDHGLGLADGLVDAASAARPSIEQAQALAPTRAEPRLAAARLALALGRTEDVLEFGRQAEGLRPQHPAHLWLRGQALYRSYRFAEARPFFERAAGLLPDDPNLLAMLARVRGLTGDTTAALQAADRLLVLDPESEDGHHQRMLALRELGDEAGAAAAEQKYLLHRRPVELDQELRQKFRARQPARAQEDAPAHTHVLSPVRPGSRP
jgi:tetratricopeptide (TPR) repeat protein/mono/diheme cytochrome c family protein